VNIVNAPAFAENLGLKVTESRVSSQEDFAELIELTATGRRDGSSVAGTFFGPVSRIVKINGRHVEARPEGVLLLLENRDRPGIVGHVGTMMGKHQVNIAGMSLSRDQAGGQALTILNLDSVPEETADERIAGRRRYHLGAGGGAVRISSEPRSQEGRRWDWEGRRLVALSHEVPPENVDFKRRTRNAEAPHL
jgi:predicted amino acid-binding ACT domain protein